MFALETIWKMLERRSRSRVAFQRFGEVRRRAHDSRLGIKLQVDLNGVTRANPARRAVRRADADQALPVHQCHAATPRMAVDRDRDQRSRAGTKSLDDTWRDDDSSGIAGRNELRSEFQFRVSMGFGPQYRCRLR